MDQDLFTFVEETSQLDPANYQYFNQLFNKRTIVFNCEIGADILERVYLPLKDFEEDDSNEPVNLIISTIGGSIHDALFLINVIDNYKKPLIITAAGEIMSMGLYLLAAGSKNPNVTKRCFKNTCGLYHSGSIGFSLTSMNAAKEMMDFQHRVDEDIKKYIIDNTKITEEISKEHGKEEWFLTGQELKDYGFVDIVL